VDMKSIETQRSRGMQRKEEKKKKAKWRES
jgi:hypothetical protein